MASQLPSQALRRTQLPSSTKSRTHAQVRHASLIKRPYRPYTFTQLVTLSDGSTFTRRTTSPAPVYKSTKDSRNHPLWQPSSAALRNMEADEAGRLRAFRKRFGRGWDAEEPSEPSGVNSADSADSAPENPMILISSSRHSSEKPSKTTEKGSGPEKN